jgi:hypothetical protein
MTTCEPQPTGGFWPTPQAHDSHPGNPARVGRFGTKHGGRNLNDEVAASVMPATLPPQPPPGDPELTLFAVDSLASPSASPGRASRRRIAGGSGQHSQASFAHYDPPTSSWKTSRVSLDGEWETYSETWPASGMTRNGTAYRRPSSVPPIYATASGLLPTPRAIYGEHPGMRDPRHLTGAVHYWPTPNASDGWLAEMAETISPEARERQHGLQSHGQNAISGSLNPTWVEWLQGYPLGWTET